MVSDKFILVDGEPRLCNDLMVWARWLVEAAQERIVAQDRIGDVLVSTVFLSIDHNFSGGAPVLWETMIFNGEHDGYQERYSTRDEAVAGHAHTLWLVKS